MSGLSRDKNHVYTAHYPPADPVTLPYSITTALKAVDKSGPLIGWAKRLTAEAAVRNLDMVARMVAEGGERAAVDYLKRLADHKRDTKANIGTRVHSLIEAVVHEQPIEIADDERPFMAAYETFTKERQPVYIAAEYMVCSLAHGYAGTGDLVVRMWCPADARVCRYRLDTKTMGVDEKGVPKGPYSETAMQLAAAEFAEFSGRPGDVNKYMVPAADHCGVLALYEDGTYAVVPYEVTRDTFEAFLAALRLWRWLQGPAKSAIGQPLPLTPQEVAA